MTSPIDIRADHLRIVQDVLQQYLPGNVKVWVFGSRASWTTKDSSDLDLALEGETCVPPRTLSSLEAAFEESDLPFAVDIVDVKRISERFRRIVAQQQVRLPERGFWIRQAWREMPFTEAFLVNPSVQIERGSSRPFVDMATVDPNFRSVRSSDVREFRGSGSRFQDGDTLMARITPCLENGKIARYCARGTLEPGHGSTEFIVVRGCPDISDTEFAFYVTRSSIVRDYAIGQMTGTSGRQRVPVESLQHLTIAVPSLPEQRAIAHILGTLDDKIDLNRQMNETLEAMARALFKSWFVDFDPVRARMEGCDTGLPKHIADLFPDRLVDSKIGEIPEGWGVSPLDEIAVFQNGLALQKYRPQVKEKRLPVVKIAQLRSGKTDSGEWATSDIRPECIIDDGDVVFSWSGSLMVAVWCSGRAALNQHLFKVTSKRFPKWFFLHNVRSHLADFQTIAAGKATTMGHIKRHHLSEAKCIVPDSRLLDAADGPLAAMFERSVSANIQSRTLAALRDALLPKLISGELRVKDAGMFFAGPS